MEEYTIGSGAEGEVRHIDTALVKKTWYSCYFTDDPQETIGQIAVAIVNRLNKVKVFAARVSAELHTDVRLPEFAGYEVENGHVVTYHQYIDDNTYRNSIDREVWFGLNKYFADFGGDNVKIQDGVIYLIDVAVSAEWRDQP